jgi:hypothetical protein
MSGKRSILNISKSKNGVYSTYLEENNEIEANCKRKNLASFTKKESFTLKLKKRRLLNHCLKRKHSMLSSLRRSDRNEIPQF